MTNVNMSAARKISKFLKPMRSLVKYPCSFKIFRRCRSSSSSIKLGYVFSMSFVFLGKREKEKKKKRNTIVRKKRGMCVSSKENLYEDFRQRQGKPIGKNVQSNSRIGRCRTVQSTQHHKRNHICLIDIR